MLRSKNLRFFWLEQLLIPATLAVGLALGVVEAAGSSLSPFDSTMTVVIDDQ